MALINKLISQALEEAAHSKALALARRFRFHWRYPIYRATASSPRALQLTDTFPALGVAVFASYAGPADEPLIREAARLVEIGAPLRQIAELMGIPMAFRGVKPGAAGLALGVVGAFQDPRIIQAYMPDSLPRMKLWLRCTRAVKRLGPEFVEWTAKHAIEIVGSPDEVLSSLKDIADWVSACYRASVPPRILTAFVGDGLPRGQEEGERFVVRPFSPDMSLSTVTKLSGDWHEAIAANISGPNSEFPEPWCPGGESHGFDIIPITSSSELYREGRALHHCVGAYQGRIRDGECYIYSVLKDGKRVATLELIQSGAGVAIRQIRGACNSQVPKELLRGVKSWLGSQREFRLPQQGPDRDFSRTLLDDDILF